MEERPDRRIIHMKTALLWGERSLCKQDNRKVGCIITTGDMQKILAIGYNGPPRPMPNDSCRNLPEGNCGCLHAEMNAIAALDSTVPSKVMFVTMAPCEMCASLIAQAEIRRVYYYQPYRNMKGKDRLRQCGVEVTRLDLIDEEA